MTTKRLTTNPSHQQIRLRPGLEAQELELELVHNNRACDVSRRALAFYLDDMNFRGLHQELGFSSTRHYAQQRLAMSRRMARTYLVVGRALRDLPLIDQAFCEGRINWSKMRGLVGIATESNEAEWLAHAEKVSTRQLELDLKGAEEGRPPRSDSKGTPTVRFKVGAKLGALDHETFQQARRLICDEAGLELDDAEILNSLVAYRLGRRTDSSEAAQNSASLYQVSVSQCSDCAKASVHTEDGSLELPDNEAERLACEGEYVFQSERKHMADAPTGPTSAAMRQRVLARDGHRCVHCHNDVDLHAHHIVFQSKGGLTQDSNLMTLCHRCHGLLHDGFLKVEGTAPHNISISDRNGNSLESELPHSGIRIDMPPRQGGTRGPLAPTPAKGKKLADLIGQQRVTENLRVACCAAKIQKRAPRHTLMCGPPGLGKTTMAKAMAVESKAPFIERNGAAELAIEELFAPKGGILFIDEIHALPRHLAEQLYAMMDQKEICVIGATTNPELMPKPLLDRFTLKAEFMNYSVGELATLVQEASKNCVTRDAALIIAKASLGVPRRALALWAAMEDRHLVAGDSEMSAEFAKKALKDLGLSAVGLNQRHLEALALLRTRCRPIGLTRLAGTIGIDSQVFRSTVEPELLRLGLIEVTPAGLIAV